MNPGHIHFKTYKGPFWSWKKLDTSCGPRRASVPPATISIMSLVLALFYLDID
jgi:hypothetical protein